MGLTVSHGAFNGAYSAFNRFRQVIAKAMGGSYPPHDDKTLERNMWYWDEGFTKESNQGLYELMIHSDCDGEIEPAICDKIANELERLLPKIQAIAEEMNETSGHIFSQGGYVQVTKYFIEGCRLATERNEKLIFK